MSEGTGLAADGANFRDRHAQEIQFVIVSQAVPFVFLGRQHKVKVISEYRAS